MVSVEDVARHAKVGRSTVSRVINENGFVSAQAKERVLRAIEELGYVPNEMARSLKNKKSNIIALMVPTVFHPFFSRLADYIEQIFYESGYKLLLVSSQGDKNKEVAIIDMINKRQVDGIIFVTHHIHDGIDGNLPIVTIDRHLGENIPFVTSDNYGGATKALSHLHDKGCKKIGFIGGKTKVESEVKKRYEAYLDFVHKNNMEENAFYEIFSHGDEMKVTKEFLSRHKDVDGLFCASDVLARSAYDNALLTGKTVPHDLKIVGFDGVLGFWSSHPEITTVAQNMEALSRECFSVMIQRIKGLPYNIKTQIPVELRIGATT